MSEITNAADALEKCRTAYDRHFHKIPATIGYDDWRHAYMAGWRDNAGWQAGWQACVEAWADHMKAMAEAMRLKGAVTRK